MTISRVIFVLASCFAAVSVGTTTVTTIRFAGSRSGLRSGGGGGGRDGSVSSSICYLPDWWPMSCRCGSARGPTGSGSRRGHRWINVDCGCQKMEVTQSHFPLNTKMR